MARRRPVRIHVNGPQLRSRTKHGTNDRVIIVKDGPSTTYARRVHILDRDGTVIAELIDGAGQRMPGCRAQVWLEVYDHQRVVVIDGGPRVEACPRT